jgi:cytidyltransferase-like protein
LNTGDKILRLVFVRHVLTKFGQRGSSGPETESLGKDLMLDETDVTREIEKLEQLGYLKLNKGSHSIELTSLGRSQFRVVMAGGTFDILHPGHVETLSEAKNMGDVLVVSIARNKTVQKNKQRQPLHDEELRKGLVSALSCVDAAILGSETDIFETVELLRPDIIVLGYDQAHSEEAIRKELNKRGLVAQVVRLSTTIPEVKTSKILTAEGGTKILSDF